MFGFGDNEDEEKLWNFMLFKFYGTDKDLKEAMPTILITTIFVILFWIVLLFLIK